MKLIFKTILFILTFSPLFGEPHLLLHFDINKTLIASDKAGNKSMEDVLNELLASKYESYWDSTIVAPMSYEDYVYEVLLPGPEYDLDLKNRRRGLLDHFIEYLQEHNHPLYPEVLKTYQTALNVLQNADGIVFPSFYQLLKELDNKQISYTVILRSFGTEVFDIGEEINTVYKELFQKNGTFQKGALIIDNEQNIGPETIYKMVRSENIAIRDDWAYWMAGETKSSFGKPFYIDLEDKETMSFFFDDNIKLDDNENNIIAPMNAKTGMPIDIRELVISGQAVRVDTLEAILNDHYFIDLVLQKPH